MLSDNNSLFLTSRSCSFRIEILLTFFINTQSFIHCVNQHLMQVGDGDGRLYIVINIFKLFSFHQSWKHWEAVKDQGEVLEVRSAIYITSAHILFTANQSYDPTQLKGRLENLISCLLESTMRFMEPQIFSLPQEIFGLINTFVCLHL